MNEITPDHLARKAIVYVRQSSEHQVRHNTGSREWQYGLKARAEALGWSEVTVIDRDLGISGSGAATRPGFEIMLDAVCNREVGIILSVDATRLSRNGREWHTLLEFCGVVGCLLADEQTVYDPRLPTDRMVLGLLCHILHKSPKHRLSQPVPQISGLRMASVALVTPGTGGSQRRGVDVASVNVGKFVDADVLGSGGNPFESGIGAGSIQGQEQTPVANIMRQNLTAGRALKAIQELRIECGLLQDIEKTRHRPGPADFVLQLDQSRGLRLAIERCDTDQVLPDLPQPNHVVLRQRRVQRSQFFRQAGTDIRHERMGVLPKAEIGVIGFAALVEISRQITVRIPVAVSTFYPDFPGPDAVAELAQHAEFVGNHVQPALVVNNKLLPAGRNGSGRRNPGRHCPAPCLSQADDQFQGIENRTPDRIVRPKSQNRQELRHHPAIVTGTGSSHDGLNALVQSAPGAVLVNHGRQFHYPGYRIDDIDHPAFRVFDSRLGNVEQQAFLAVNPLDVTCDPDDHLSARPRLKAVQDLQKEINQIIRQLAVTVHEIQGIEAKAPLCAMSPHFRGILAFDTATQHRDPARINSRQMIPGQIKAVEKGQSITGAENVVEGGSTHLALHAVEPGEASWLRETAIKFLPRVGREGMST